MLDCTTMRGEREERRRGQINLQRRKISPESSTISTLRAGGSSAARQGALHAPRALQSLSCRPGNGPKSLASENFSPCAATSVGQWSGGRDLGRPAPLSGPFEPMMKFAGSLWT